jgi:predicted aconitase
MSGLHLDAGRRARVVFVIEPGLGQRLAENQPAAELYGLVGHLVGRRAGTAVPALLGMPPSATEDDLKSLGAAAASSGSVALCHVVGVTPEAPSLEAACGGVEPERSLAIGPADLAAAWQELTTASEHAPLAAVSVGTPHFSSAEFGRLDALLGGRRVHADIAFYASTGRDVLEGIEPTGLPDRLRASGVTLVTDTCTYITPILQDAAGPVMTDSGKWAWYAPSNLGFDVALGSLEDCVRSAAAGVVTRDEALWTG